ncbi:MAG: PDZ domain-containing protein [Gemmatimonadota bacterium]
MRRTLLVVSSLATIAAAPIAAQSVRVISPGQNRIVFTSTDDDGRAMIGVSTSSGGKRDTLGVLVTAVTEGGPAEKAGLTEGDRVQSINTVSLRVSRDDAGDDEMGGIMQRRLTRELGKVKAGDEVTLQVWHDGASRSYKVKTVAADDLLPRKRTVRSADERAVIGIGFGFTGSKRDTAGVFVNAVTEDGPAEKAGIIEGDRIAAVNGVSLKVSKDDIEDGWAASSRMNRLSREVARAKPGDVLELTVVSGGRARAVKVTTVKASSLKGHDVGGFTFFRSPEAAMAPMPPIPPMSGMMRHAPAAPHAPAVPRAPTVRWRSFNDADAGVDVRIEMDGVRREIERELRNELPRARVEMRQGLEQMRKELQAVRTKVRTGSVRM